MYDILSRLNVINREIFVTNIYDKIQLLLVL